MSPSTHAAGEATHLAPAAGATSAAGRTAVATSGEGPTHSNKRELTSAGRPCGSISRSSSSEAVLVESIGTLHAKHMQKLRCTQQWGAGNLVLENLSVRHTCHTVSTLSHFL